MTTDVGAVLREGAQRHPDLHGRFFSDDAYDGDDKLPFAPACAIGTIFLETFSMAPSRSDPDYLCRKIVERYPHLRQHVPCPEGCQAWGSVEGSHKGMGVDWKLWDFNETAIAMCDHLYEVHTWPRDRIADWLDTLPDVDAVTMPNLVGRPIGAQVEVDE